MYPGNYDIEERMKLKRVQINESIYYVHISKKNLTFLKCPYFSKKPGGSMQFLSKQQYHFSQN